MRVVRTRLPSPPWRTRRRLGLAFVALSVGALGLVSVRSRARFRLAEDWDIRGLASASSGDLNGAASAFTRTLTGFGMGEYANARAAAARHRAELINQDALTEQADLEVIEAHEAVRSWTAAITAAEEGLAAADETRAITKSRFEKGTGLSIEVSAAQEARTRAATNLVDAIVNYNKAQYRLLVSIGERPAR